jgi:hypothetical protein
VAGEGRVGAQAYVAYWRILWGGLCTILQGAGERIVYAEAALHLHIVGMKFSFSRLPDETTRVPGFCGEDAGVAELDVVSQVNAVLPHSCSVRMFYPDIPMVLFQPGVDRTVCLSDVDLATLTGDTVYSWCSQPQVSLYRPHIPRVHCPHQGTESPFSWPPPTQRFL